MKKTLLYALMLLLGMPVIYSCNDDENVSEATGREFMTMFRKDDNTGKGDTDPYNCHVQDLNDVHLYWYGVNDAAGYEIKMALQPTVASGLATDWENPDNILIDTIVGPDVLDIVLKDLQYSTDYRFAIRTLSTKGEGFHSKWYGYGNGREWAEYLGLTTESRYEYPEVIVGSNVTKTGLRVTIDRRVATSGTPAQIEEYKMHFNTEDFNGEEVFTMQYLEVSASNSNPDAQVPEQWKNYRLTDEDFERGYIDIDGLDQNSVYLINVEDKTIPVHWDAIYNTLAIRMDGDPGEPILIEHIVDPNDTIPGAVEYNACRLDTIINNYNHNAELAEGQIFYLEGGKTYYLEGNTSLYKGFTLATDPKDIEAGKGNAKVLLGGMATEGTNVRSNNFMFGRQPVAGEDPNIRINVKALIFEHIDFDCPLARNYGDYEAGSGSTTGNYFANMYSNGMGVQIQEFRVTNCTFQRMVRGFVRTQGSHVKVFEKFVVEGCSFYNDGFYSNGGGGYPWIAADASQAKSNVFTNMIWRNNTIYDSPYPSLFNNSNANLAWDSNLTYNITFENNTVVNFNTRATGCNIFGMRYLPGGSKLTVRNNLFILTRKAGDTRNMYFSGAEIRGVNGSGILIIDCANNWSTNTNLTNGEIFSANAFSAKRRSFGTYPDWLVNDESELVVHVDNISPEELMVDPNPPHVGGDKDMHERDNLDGLYYNQTDKVRNSNIYQLGVGASKWRR